MLSEGFCHTGFCHTAGALARGSSEGIPCFDAHLWDAEYRQEALRLFARMHVDWGRSEGMETVEFDIDKVL